MKSNVSLLSDAIMKIAPRDGDYQTKIPALKLYRRSRVSEPMPGIYGLGLGVAVQGAKRVSLGDEIFDYNPSQSLVTSVNVPVISRVRKASASEPFLALWLDLDSKMISQLAADMDFTHHPKLTNTRALSVVEINEELLDALYRLVRVLDEPVLLPNLSPLIQQEIAVRLLNGKHGALLRHLVTIGSPSQQISKVISWLKINFAEDLPVEALAVKAHMSPSTFRQHFRAVAGLSPLQYIKNLRLQEARQLMIDGGIDASSAAVRVGYESASQFSREYARLFGSPPLRDIKKLRVS